MKDTWKYDLCDLECEVSVNKHCGQDVAIVDCIFDRTDAIWKLDETKKAVEL